ncbi:MAG: peptidoglycan-binding protein [Patescibacteria group bacterium]|nr:peptidoglycan-binding protein [Patescibacteria group bacterium]MDE2116600.1 peptidoglycan-binding protein [Patescibacteria group bacterium]
MKNKLLQAAGCAFVLACIGPFAAFAACPNLTLDLSYGVTDRTAGGQVLALQEFLVSEHYLSATPNGVFGPATLSGTIAFQAANNVPPTGYVGPLTRSAVALKACSAPVPVTASTPTPAVSTSGTSVVVPGGGESLSIGQTYTVEWNAPSGNVYNVVLEDATGTPQGFIVAGSYARQFSWNIGVVNNAGSSATETVPPGTYKIRVENAATGAQSSDQESGVFTIGDSVNISQVFPQTAPADGKTTVIFYGSGFNSNSMIDIYGYGNISPMYVSPDGRAMALTIPADVFPGIHSVAVMNTYTASDASGGATTQTYSNTMNITVVRP